MQNVHPLFVHFPIALLLTAAAFAWTAVLLRRPNAAQVARALLYLGTLSAAATVITGFLGAQRVAPVHGTHGIIEEHENFAYALLGAACALTAWTFVAWRRTQAAPRPAWLWLAAHAVVVVLVFLAGREGGELVHDHGVGTALTAPGGPLHESAPARPDSSAAPKPSGRDFK